MKTKRSNIPEKRAHWKSARTERRGRFANGIKALRDVMDVEPEPHVAEFEAVDQDKAFRGHDRTTERHGRVLVHWEGHRARVMWNTADKSRIKWQIEHGRIDPVRADELRRSLHLRF